jgi:predicted transcriptional regulator
MSAVEVVCEPTLGELAETYKREHGLTLEAGASMVTHAIHAGEALLAAKQQIPHGKWLKWLESNFGSGSMPQAYRYMRIAQYRDMTSSASEIGEAIELTRGLPPATKVTDHPEIVRVEARKLHAEGASYYEIGQVLGVDRSSVRMWVSPTAYAEKKRQRSATKKQRVAERRALEREKQAAEMRQASGDLGKAYSHTRSALDAFERLRLHATSETRPIIDAAMSRLYAVEEAATQVRRLT